MAIDKYHIAVHESGHVFAAVLCGDTQYIDKVSITEKGANVATAPPFVICSREGMDNLFSHICELVGGYMAVKVCMGKKDSGAWSDETKVEQYLLASGMPHSVQMHFKKTCEWFVEEGIRRNIDEFNIFVDKLMCKDELSKDEITKLLDGKII